MKKECEVYLLVTFGFSWLLWLPLLINHVWHARLPVLDYQFFMASFGPLLGATAAQWYKGGYSGTRNWLAQCWRVKVGLAVYIWVLTLLAAFAILAVILILILKGQLPYWRQWGITQKLPGLNAWQVALVWMLTFGLGEETGWRGWLLPQLQHRFTLRTSILLVAAIWMLWHLPAFFFNENYLAMGWGVIGWAISLAYGSVVLSWLYIKSRYSIIPVVVWHGGFDLLTAGDYVDPLVPAVCSTLVILQGIIIFRWVVNKQ